MSANLVTGGGTHEGGLWLQKKAGYTRLIKSYFTSLMCTSLDLI